MPNHVTTIIEFDSFSDEGKTIKEKIKGENSEIDFEKIIPMPETIYREDLTAEKEEELGKENCWYEWSIKNWGTKWNAYDSFSDEYGTLVFRTAWNSPQPVIKELSKMFPETEFIILYADEDEGNNLGAYKIKNGRKYHEMDMPTGTLEAEYFAKAVRQMAYMRKSNV